MRTMTTKEKRELRKGMLALISLIILMGVIGWIEQEPPAPQAHIDEAVNVRDSLVKAQDSYVMDMIMQSKGDKPCQPSK